MKKLLLTLLGILSVVSSFSAEKEKIKFNFYGFVRNDYYLNSRKNVDAVDGVFYLLPTQKILDINGEDINGGYNSSFYAFASRLGLNVSIPNLLGASSSAKIETDFGGFSTTITLLRIRQAYFKLDWTRCSLLAGQTWHPLFGNVFPDIVNLNTGAPYQAFNRSPQIQFQYKLGDFAFTGAAIWQLQYLSSGPISPSNPNGGKSGDYIKYSNVPEFFIGAEYNRNGLVAGIGGELLSITPRTTATHRGETVRVHERITTTSAMAYASYGIGKLRVAGKTYLAQNLSHASMLGGYGISSVNADTQEQTYTPFTHSTSWVNVTYGSTWKVGIFGGYSKNLGSSKPLVSNDVYGLGLNVDQLFTVNLMGEYNYKAFRFGLEYGINTAYYGKIDLETGRVKETSPSSNLRLAAVCIYNFSLPF